MSMLAPQRGHRHAAGSLPDSRQGSRWLWRRCQQLTGERQFGAAATVGDKTVLPDADEAAEELRACERHLSAFVSVSVIPPVKGHVPAIEAQQAVVADCDTMRVPPEVTKDLRGTAKGRFCINDPVFAEQRPEEGSKTFWFGEHGNRAGAAQLAAPMQPTKSCDECSAKYTAEHFHRQNERVPWMNPARVVGRQAADRNGAMQRGAATGSVPRCAEC